MSEKSPENRPFRMPISHAEAILDPEMREPYIEQRMTAIRAGKAVWMLDDLENIQPIPDPVVRIDFYFDTLPFGYVAGSEEDGWHSYGPPLEEEEVYHHLNTEPVDSIAEAQEKLIDYLHGTGQIRR